MMRRITTVLPFAVFIGGCAVPTTSYIDSNYHVEHYEDLIVPPEPLKVHVEAHSKVNDIAVPRDDADFTAAVKRVLIRSGVFEPVEGAAPASLVVEVNDLVKSADIQKGYMTGLTFGSKKNIVYDSFEVTVFFKGPNDVNRLGRYKHQIVTTNGEQPPPGFTGRPMNYQGDSSDDYIIQDTLLSFLKDYQNASNQPGSMIFMPTGAGTQAQ